MRPLVYDFGQLNNATEKQYIEQIVKNRSKNIAGVSGGINAITNVLIWSQSYMKKKKVSVICI